MKDHLKYNLTFVNIAALVLNASLMFIKDVSKNTKEVTLPLSNSAFTLSQFSAIVLQVLSWFTSGSGGPGPSDSQIWRPQYTI